MFIRAYRVRGHLAANLDPLSNYEIKKLDPALDPKTYGFVEEDMDRKIFLDNVLGLQEASMNQISEIVKKLTAVLLHYNICIFQMQKNQPG